MTNKSIRDYINLIENAQREDVAEGLINGPYKVQAGEDGYYVVGPGRKLNSGSVFYDSSDADEVAADLNKKYATSQQNNGQGVVEGTGTVTASSIVNFIKSEINRYYEQDNDFAAQWLAELVHVLTDSRPGWKNLTYDEIMQYFIQYDIDRLLKDGSWEARKIAKVYHTLKQQLIAKFGPEQGVAEGTDQELVKRQVSYWDQVAKEKKNKEREALKAKKAEYEKTPAGKAEKYWSQKGVAEGSEQVYKVLAVDKSNALSKQVKLNVKASSLDEVFERLAINDWYPLEINGVEVINGKRLKQGVEEEQLEETTPEALAKIDELTRK